jgi:glucose-1-phosphate thymidylyltransferase
MGVETAIILAAGYGTRLGLSCSKPLIEVGDKPIISWLVEKLIEAGIEKIYVVTNDLYYSDYQNWLNSVEKVTLINDGTRTNEERLGALRDLDLALSRAYNKNHQPTIVLLGDNVFEEGLSGIIEAYEKTTRTTIAVYDVGDLELAKRYGIVEIDDNGQVSIFEEKPQNPKTTLASVGIYVFSSDDLRRLPDYLNEKNPADGPGNFIPWLVRKSTVYAYRLRGKWWDIGSIDSLNEAQKYFREK